MDVELAEVGVAHDGFDECDLEVLIVDIPHAVDVDGLQICEFV